MFLIMCNAACLQYCIVKEDICNQIFGDNFDFDENSNDKNDEDDCLCDWQKQLSTAGGNAGKTRIGIGTEPS